MIEDETISDNSDRIINPHKNDEEWSEVQQHKKKKAQNTETNNENEKKLNTMQIY